MKRSAAVLLLFACIFVCSCQRSAPGNSSDPQSPVSRKSETPQIILSILPVERAAAMYEKFLPLKYYLERTLKVQVVIKIAKDYETAVLELGEGKVQIACLDPATYCEVRARYKQMVRPLVKVLGREGTASRSVLIVKDNSDLKKVVDLKGKRIALGSQQSSFSYIIPLALLSDVGLTTRDLASVDYLQQEDRVALSVLIGNHEAGGISESVAKRYVADGVRIIKTSEAIPQFMLCGSEQLSREMRERITEALVSLRDSAVLSSLGEEVEGFGIAEDRDFDVVRVMIRHIAGKDYIEYGRKTIRVAILPLYSAITIYDMYEPLMRYLSLRTGYEFKLVIPRDFEDFIRVVKSGTVDFSYQNPYVFSLIHRDTDIRPLATTVDDWSEGQDTISSWDKFRGVVIAKSDSPVKEARDLVSRKVLVVSRKSAGGYLSQKLFFEKMGIDVERDMRIEEAKRQENVILGVYRGEAEAGFVREAALEVLKDEIDLKQIRIVARTTSLPNWPFAVCRNFDSPLAADVRRLLVELNDKAILGAAKIMGFKNTTRRDFDLLRKL